MDFDENAADENNNAAYAVGRLGQHGNRITLQILAMISVSIAMTT